MVQTPSAHEKLSEQFQTLLLTFEDIAQSHFANGQLGQALQIFQIGMQVLRLPEACQQDRTRFLIHYGNMLAAKTQFENAPVETALVALEQARQLAAQIDDAQLIADALNGIGFAYYVSASNKRTGDPEIFRTYFQQALDLRRSLHDERGVSESLFHLGLTMQVLDLADEARMYYTQALQIAQQEGYITEASDALRHLGFLEVEQENYALAQRHLLDALHLREQSGLRVYLPFATVAVADVYLAQGELSAAYEEAQKALEQAQATDIKKALLFALECNGRICQARQDLQQARDYFEQAYAVAQSIDLAYAIQQLATILHYIAVQP